MSILTRFKYAFSLGPVAGFGCCAYFIMSLVILYVCEWIFPKESIDIAEDFNTNAYKTNPEKFGDHLFNVNPKTTKEKTD
jgi:hypothetical protein